MLRITSASAVKINGDSLRAMYFDIIVLCCCRAIHFTYTEPLLHLRALTVHGAASGRSLNRKIMRQLFDGLTTQARKGGG